MIVRTLNINQVDVARNPVLYSCHGLGPCIALFLTDRLQNLAGGAHISWSSFHSANQCKNEVKIVNELLAALYLHGSDLKHLRAKLAGGAKVFESSFNVGEENVKAVVECLIIHKVFIAASDVGGHAARTVQFNGLSGELRISTSDQKVYSI